MKALHLTLLMELDKEKLLPKLKKNVTYIAKLFICGRWDVCEGKCCRRVWVMTGMLRCLTEEGPNNYR